MSALTGGAVKAGRTAAWLRYLLIEPIRYDPPIATSHPRRAFDFSANHVALDFVNTVGGRPTYTRDDLVVVADVFDWASAAGLLHPDEQVKHDATVASQLAAAVALRESLYGVFGPIAHGENPQPSALAFLTRRAAQAMRSSRWQPGAAGYQPQWRHGSVEGICDHLADEAVQLLRSPATDRIGACAGCGWLFLDTSRAHARRWCSMNACGVRSKMRRYHERQTTGAGAS